MITTLAGCADDRLLLCSDGLSDVVEHDGLQAVMLEHAVA